ncbi:MAG: hypothetical protein AB7Q37_02465 [Pyrinomonadaceae bacterium]
MKNFRFTTSAAMLALVFSFSALAQSGPKTGKQPSYNYAAQKSFLPPDLGQVYLGMPLSAFASKIDISKAEADDRFDFLQLEVPFERGNIHGLTIRVHGLEREQMDAMLATETETRKNSDGTEYQVEMKRPRVSSIKGGVVYSMYIAFKPGYDLRYWAQKAYGKGDIRAKDDPYHIYDQQWVKRTGDGLGWLIRAFYGEKGGSLQLLGRVPGSEWDPGA